jgi:hypothetical protein
MGTIVHNVQECGYKHITSSLGKVYAYNTLFHMEQLEITHVQIIKNKTKDHRRDLVATTRQISYTVMFGVVGAMLANPSGVSINIELDIYTADGTVFEIWTDERKLVKSLLPYMHVKDPRDKYRKMRGVK